MTRRRGDPKWMDGRVSMTLSHGGAVDAWTIRLEDADSGLMLCEVELAPEEFAMALGARANQQARVRVWDSFDDLGKRLETKTVVVPGLADRWDDWDALVAPYETDGWEADTYDRTSYGGRPNRHRVDQDGGYSVNFHRLVARKDTDAPAAAPDVIEMRRERRT